jgi:hypothetical protein
VPLVEREASASMVAKWYIRKCGFQQKCQEIGPLNNGRQRASASIKIIPGLLVCWFANYYSPISKMS